MNKDNGMLWSCMCSLIEILWVLEEKIKSWLLATLVWLPGPEIFEFNPTCKLSLFSIKLSELVGYFYYLWEAKSIWKEIQAFEAAIWCLGHQ